MSIPDLSILAWIILTSLIGGALSVVGAGLVAFKAHSSAVPMLISYAIGAMLGAVFLEILPEAINATVKNGGSVQATTTTVLFGILLFFGLEKLVIWRHCHGDHCEVHAIHTEENCPETHPDADAKSVTKYKAVSVKQPVTITLPFFCSASPMASRLSCTALSIKPQVLTTTKSAPS